MEISSRDSYEGGIVKTEVINPIAMLHLKAELVKELRRNLGRKSVKKAVNDGHARRPPRPCGITIHTAHGCAYGCLYCYIAEMGEPLDRTSPYELSGEEVTLALLENPWFVPGRYGTFIAIGSITEPFHPKVAERTLEYIRAFSKYLGNPIQFSTKSYISRDLADRIVDVADGTPICPLITIVTIKHARNLEKHAPSPDKRFESISNLRDAGLKPFLFLRPIIPGVTDQEFEEILGRAKDAGAEGVIIGTLRVSQKIIERMYASGIDMKQIRMRVGRVERRQVYIRGEDLKRRALKVSQEVGLLAYKSACCANAYTANVTCANVCWMSNFCVNCPNDCRNRIPQIKLSDVEWVLERILDFRPIDVEEREGTLRIVVPPGLRKKTVGWQGANVLMFKTLFRRAIRVEEQ